MSIKLITSLILFSVPLTAYCCEVDLHAMEFAEKVRRLIVSGNVKNFQSLPCVPTDCIGEDDIEYVFGTSDDESFIRKFLKNPNVKARVFGPYIQEDGFGKSSFSIVYYDPSLVDFNKDGYMDPDDRRDQWNKGYVETRITCMEGGCAFHRTPFYYGAHIPWMDDY